MGGVQDLNATQPFAATRAFDTALYLGPGLGDIALSLSSAHAKRLVAFCDAATCRRLGAQGADSPIDIASHPAIVSPLDNTYGMHAYNVQGFASVRPATGLNEIFPGLREGPRVNVETRPVQAALEEADLTGRNNLLILGANGCEADVLDALAQTEGGPLFSRIILPLPNLSLYESSQNGAFLTTKLEAECYRQIWVDDSDPDLPLAAFDLDETLLKHRAELAERDTQIDVLTDKVEELTSSLKDLQDQHDAEQRDRASDAAQAQQALTEAKEQIKTLVADRKTLSTLRKKHNAALDTGQQKHSSTAKALSKARAKVARLEKQINTLRAQQDGVLVKAFKEMDAREYARDKSGDDQTITLQLQELRHADLINLRSRYQSLKSENDHLTDLLSRIYHSLNALKRDKSATKKISKRP